MGTRVSARLGFVEGDGERSELRGSHCLCVESSITTHTSEPTAGPFGRCLYDYLGG